MRCACAVARPFIMTNLRIGQGLDDIVRFIEEKGALGEGGSTARSTMSA